MLETLVNIDRSLFLAINGLNSHSFDIIMYWISDRIMWIPLYLLLALFIYRRYGKPGIFMILFASVLILLSDQGSVLVKNITERFRPCHDDSLAFQVHTIRNKCGGLYGFVSSHAANTMAVFTYLLLIARNQNKKITLVTALWVVLTGYSRVYAGVHFPADIVGGWMVGIIAAFCTYVLYRLIFERPAALVRT